MALVTKIKLTPNYDWKSILLEDISGTGITGYGTNQDPVGYREVSSIETIRLELTSPGLITTTINITGGTLTTFKNTLQYTITNLALGYLTDEIIEEGIWTVVYTPFFSNDIATGLTVTTPNTSLTYLTVNKTSFVNSTKLIKISGGVYSNILSNTIGATTSTLATSATQISMAGDEYYVGLGVTGYTSITKELKECLDNKIADESLCPCDCEDCSLMQKYLLYEAIELNCKQNNYTKANQIFTYLTEKIDCGC
jgi:hypothetical protein